MAYVGESFQHDIFVSYSHGTDEQGDGYLQPWSGAFVDELIKEFRSDPRFRNKLEVFFDQALRPSQGIDPMAPLTSQLRDSIASSALLLVLMSEDYLQSAWCTKEREWWHSNQPADRFDIERRISIVKAWKTDHHKWPAEFNEHIGFDFHTDDPLTPRPLGWIDFPPGPFGRDFRRAMLDIVGRIGARLDEIKAWSEERQRADEDAGRLGMDTGQSIYLHSRADFLNEWTQTAQTLVNDGFAVVGEPMPNADDARSINEARKQRVSLMCDCDAVLLLGASSPQIVEQDLIAVGKNDRQSARAQRNRLLPCALLDTNGTYATPLRRASARNLQVDWLDATSAPWTTTVRHWLTEQSRHASPAK